MPRPHGRTATRVHPNSRAIVLEAEWKVMPERIATELRPLVKLAKDQGWTIDGSGNGKLVWRGPNGEGPVYTGYRCQGRDLQNYRAELVRNGLKLDERTAKEHINQENYEELLATSEASTVDEVLAALQLITANVAVYAAKAEAFNEAKGQIAEWQQMAEEAIKDSERVAAKLSEATAMLDAIRQCFDLAPWAILPEIARLLGIDANGPSIRIPTPEGAKKS